MSNEELIAEAREAQFVAFNDNEVGYALIIRALADALEAQSAPRKALSCGNCDYMEGIEEGMKMRSALLVADSQEALVLACVSEIERLMPSNQHAGDLGRSVADQILASGVVSLAADRDRATAERAWAEGHDAALWNAQWPQDRKSNPYRESEGK